MQAVDGVSLTVEPRQHARHRRRVRLRQERLDADGDGPHARRRQRDDLAARSLFEGRDLLRCRDDELRALRGNDIAMIFQDPLVSLHPFYKIGDQLVEAIRAHRDVSQGAGAATARSSCSASSASPSRGGASTPTRTSSPAACASAR